MNQESIVLITKDALSTDYLPVYGNKYWKGKTPNLDELAEKGTVCTRFITAAPSSAMAYLSMFTGKYPYEQNIKSFTPVTQKYDGITFFDKAAELGFKCHIIWDEMWMKGAYLYSECYGKDTKIHPLDNLRQGVGSHYIHDGFLMPDDKKSEATLKMLENKIAEVFKQDEKVFLWVHIPHVLNGRVSYGADIDLFDRCIGIVRKFVDDSNVFVSADHGNMNGHRGKTCYGFDVYEAATRIPLIVPMKEGNGVFDGLLSNVDLYSIVFDRVFPVREVAYSDSAYYAQPNRKLGVWYKKYSYIYNKKTKIEELYDTEWDPQQQFNLFDDWSYDVDRNVKTPSRELYFYPEWENLPEIRIKMRAFKDDIWRDENIILKIVGNLANIARKFKKRRKKIQ